MASFVIGLFILSITGVANATLFVNVPFETAGNEPQSSPGPYSLGLNFDVVSPIQVTSLGAFDSLSDGIFLSEIQVAIFNRETKTLVTPILTFTSEDHGTSDGSNGFTFKSLSVPVNFDAGFLGVVVANGYNGVGTNYEPFGNIVHPGAPVTTFNDGGGLLNNLGWYSYNRPTTSLTYDPLIFSELQFSSNPLFAGPSFSYDAAPSAVPEPATMLLLGSGLIGLAGYSRKKFRKLRN